MTPSFRIATAVVFAASLFAINGVTAFDTRFGPVTMQGELPDPASIDKLYEELDFQQATQTYLWSLPLVSYAQWEKEFREKWGARNGDLVVLTRYEDKLGVITANATTPYIIGFVDLSETGPLVIDMPAGPTAGGVGDFWQRAVTDMGQTGPDEGKGGKYLVLPSGTDIPGSTDDYYVTQSKIMNILVGFRVLNADPAKGQALVEQFRMYPLRDKANPGPVRLISLQGRRGSGTQPRGMEYWRRLHQIIQRDSSVQDKESNWLPSSSRPFYVVLRLYMSKPEMFEG